MKIAIDGYEANVLQRLGSSQVAFELLRNLERIDHKNDYTIFLPSPPLGDLPRQREGWKYKILKLKKLWTRIALPIALYMNRKKYDLFFSPTHYIPRFSPIRRVVTIFDLSFLHFPQMFNNRDLWQLKNWTKFSAENADHIITISNFSKQDIITNYKLDKNKITVAYPGYNKEIFSPRSQQDIKRIKKKYNIDDSYVIYIGTIQPRKNLIRLIEALSRIDKLKLVIVGKTKGEGRSGWMYKEILESPKKFAMSRRLAPLALEDRVIFTNFLPTEDLPSLISGAEVFVQPSLWEGFGIPVLEAMACGTPVVCSNTSSLPEVVGMSGLLIDPYSINQIEQAIRTIISDKKLRQKYSRLAIQQAKKFSWEKMARGVLKTFENLS